MWVVRDFRHFSFLYHTKALATLGLKSLYLYLKVYIYIADAINFDIGKSHSSCMYGTYSFGIDFELSRPVEIH